MDRNDENDGQPARLPQQRSSVPSFLFLIFMLFILTNHTGDEFLARNHYQDALQSLNYQLSNFTAWLNGTESNFTMVRAQLFLAADECLRSAARQKCRRHPSCRVIHVLWVSSQPTVGILFLECDWVCARRDRLLQYHPPQPWVRKLSLENTRRDVHGRY